MMMLYLPSGSPTAELFAASYNNGSNKSNTITLGVGTYGYTKNTDDGWLSVNDNHGIYNKSTSSYWWLASPYDFDSASGLGVHGRFGCFRYISVDNFYDAVRPLVCIPTSLFNSKYATSTTLVDE
jgi:hypothetical protein